MLTDKVRKSRDKKKREAEETSHQAGTPGAKRPSGDSEATGNATKRQKQTK